MTDKALQYLHTDPVFYMDMIEPIRRGTADILEASQEGVLLRETASRVYMMATESPAAAERFINRIPEGRFFSIHQSFYADAIMKKFGVRMDMTCNQAVWMRKEPPPIPNRQLTFRTLTPSDAERVHALYSHAIALEYIPGRIHAGEMIGAYVTENLAGFVGLHEEGSVGILEVLPDFRRQQIGTSLVAYLSGQLIRQGRVPFSQFVIGNHASKAMLEGMGFTVSERQLYWLD